MAESIKLTGDRYWDAECIHGLSKDALSERETGIVSTNISLDDLKEPGVYRLWGTYDGAWTTSNIYGFLLVIGTKNVNASVQLFLGATSAIPRYRGFTNNQWYAWKAFTIT